MRRRRREMYRGHPRLCVCVSVRGRMPAVLHGPGCNLGSRRGCPLVVHCWADLQSGHGLCCYGNVTRTRNVSEYMPVLALCPVYLVFAAFLSALTLAEADRCFKCLSGDVFRAASAATHSIIERSVPLSLLDNAPNSAVGSIVYTGSDCLMSEHFVDSAL